MGERIIQPFANIDRKSHFDEWISEFDLPEIGTVTVQLIDPEHFDVLEKRPPVKILDAGENGKLSLKQETKKLTLQVIVDYSSNYKKLVDCALVVNGQRIVGLEEPDLSEDNPPRSTFSTWYDEDGTEIEIQVTERKETLSQIIIDLF